MTPELNVLRLQRERHYKKIKGKRRLITVLVTRDEHGKVQSYAESEWAKAHLRRFWREYNERTKTENLPASKELRQKLALLFRELRRKGFTHQKIFYGVVKDRKTGKTEYKRIHIFKASAWTIHEKILIRDFFKKHIPKTNLGIYVYHKNKLHMYRLDSYN